MLLGLNYSLNSCLNNIKQKSTIRCLSFRNIMLSIHWFYNLLWITDSNIFDRVGRIDICLWFVFEDFWPDLLKTAVMWVSFQMSGKGPISNILLNNLEMEYDIGFAMRWIPQWNTTIWFVPVIYVKNEEKLLALFNEDVKMEPMKFMDQLKTFFSIIDVFKAFWCI